MTLKQIIDASREILKDELDSARTFPDNSSSFFTDGEMTTWYNLTQLEVQNELVQSFEHYFVTSTSINLVKDQEEYSMPADNLKIVRVEDIENTSAPIPIVPISFNDKDRSNWKTNLDITALGNVHNYAIKGNSFVFRPRPTNSRASGVRVYYIQRAATLNSASSCSTIPDQYHEALLWGIIRRGYIKQEASAEALTIAETNFARLVGNMTRTAENRQIQRSRSIRRKKRY